MVYCVIWEHPNIPVTFPLLNIFFCCSPVAAMMGAPQCMQLLFLETSGSSASYWMKEEISESTTRRGKLPRSGLCQPARKAVLRYYLCARLILHCNIDFKLLSPVITKLLSNKPLKLQFSGGEVLSFVACLKSAFLPFSCNWFPSSCFFFFPVHAFLKISILLLEK